MTTDEGVEWETPINVDKGHGDTMSCSYCICISICCVTVISHQIWKETVEKFCTYLWT